MTNNKQQTAVEWLFSETLGITLQLANKRISHRNWELQMVKLYEQAKEMDKEKHEKFNKLLNDEKQLEISDLKTVERIQWYYNTYFNETYGDEQQ
jgi:hypothetical protein